MVIDLGMRCFSFRDLDPGCSGDVSTLQYKVELMGIKVRVSRVGKAFYSDEFFGEGRLGFLVEDECRDVGAVA